ncbi:MAG: hypothetical protein JWO63_2635 [Frankiales bacterium]|nr:hypothetical protein [Frankiales bacterium]
MRVASGLSPTELLELTDAGAASDSAERGLLLLAAARPDLSADALEGFGLGARDAWVMDLRCATFGDELSGRVACPACATSLAVAISRDEIGLEPGEQGAAVPVWVELDGTVVEARTPDGSALLAAAAQPDVEAARRSLIASCVVQASAASGAIAPLDLPAAVLEAVGEAILAADPGAEVGVPLDCAVCAHRWTPVLDPVLFFWAELHAAGTQLLDDVHQLAAGYGWSEPEVLRLSASRRRRYVDRLLDV